MRNLLLLCAALAHAKSVSTSLCDLPCDSNSNTGLPISTAQRYSFTSQTSLNGVLQDSGRFSFSFLGHNECTFTLKKDDAQMKFHLTNGRIETVCPIQGSVEEENELKAIASMLQIATNAKADQDMITDAVGLCKVSYEKQESGEEVRTKNFDECVFHPERDFDFFNPYDALANNWFGRSVQKCQFSRTRINAGVECLETHRFDGKDIDDTDLTEGTIQLMTSIRPQGRTNDADFESPNPERAVESLTVQLQPHKEHPDLRSMMTAACSKRRTALPNDAPFKFIQLVDAFNGATAGALDSLFNSLDGICANERDLDAKRTFLDALIWCGSDSCVNVASDLMTRGQIDDELLESWLFSFTLNPNPTPGMASMVAKAVKSTSGARYERGILALGALVHRICRHDSPAECQAQSGVAEALAVLEHSLGNSCSGERKTLLNALKAVGNAGLFSNGDAIRACLQRNDEIAVEAANALRRAPCDSARFAALTNVIGNVEGDLEVRQTAYIRAWDCPSIELSHFAENLVAREPSENFKNLIFSHAIAQEGFTDKSSISLFEGILSLSDGLTSAQQSSFFEFANGGNGFDVLKLNNPGSILPRSIAANMNVNKFGMASSKLFGAKIRAQNIENGIISVLNPINETAFENDTEEREQRRLLGIDQQPRLRLDLTVFDNDVFSLDMDDMTSVLDELADDWRKAMEMSAIEKMKAVFGYSKEGILKYFNNDPVDYQKEFMFMHHRASYPNSLGKLITSEIQGAALMRLKADGTLSGAGFNGQLAPQASVVVSTHVTMDDLELASKMTVTANFESALGISYNPLSGTMEVRIAKPKEDLTLLKVETEVISPPRPGPAAMAQNDGFEFPLMGFSMRFMSSERELNPSNLFQPAYYAIQYSPEDATPIIFTGQYDPSDGIIARVFAQSAAERSLELYFNYRESDSHLLVQGRMLDKEFALEGEIGKKKFNGRVTQSGLLPEGDFDIAAVGIDVEDKATDAQNAAGIYKPSMTLDLNGSKFKMEHGLFLRSDGMLYEVQVDAGQMGQYYISHEMKKTFPQFATGIYIGGKPDADLAVMPSYGVRVGLEQVEKVNRGGYSLEAVAMVGSDKFGIENSIVVTDKDVEIKLRTLQLLGKLFDTEELELDFGAKWAAKRGKIKYQLNLATLSIPKALFVNKGKVTIESDQKSTKNQMTKGGFNGKQTFTQVNVQLQFRIGDIDGKKESLEVEMQSAVSKMMDRAVLNVAFKEMSFAPDYTLRTEAHYEIAQDKVEFGVVGALNDMEIKALGGVKSEGNLKKLNAIFQFPGGKYGIESEWEIVDAKNIRIVFIPNMNGKTYPTQLVFRDQSTDTLWLLLDISMTGVVPKAMQSSGQDDTYTIRLSVEENPKYAYKMKATLFMHDFGKTERMIEGYTAEIDLHGTDKKQGMQMRARSSGTDIIRITAIREKTSEGNKIVLGSLLEDKQIQLEFNTNSQKKASEIWRKNLNVEIVQVGMIPGMSNDPLELDFAVAGKTNGFSIEVAVGESMQVLLAIDTAAHRGNLLIKQSFIQGQGYDQIELIGAWNEAKNMFIFTAKRNARQKMIDAKLYILDNGVKFAISSNDKEMEGLVPRKSLSKVTVEAAEAFEFNIQHTHQLTSSSPKTQGGLRIHAAESVGGGVSFNWDKKYSFVANMDYSKVFNMAPESIIQMAKRIFGIADSFTPTGPNGDLVTVAIEVKADARSFMNKVALTNAAQSTSFRLLMKQNFDAALSNQVVFQIMGNQESHEFTFDHNAAKRVLLNNCLIRLADGPKTFSIGFGTHSTPSALQFKLGNAGFFPNMAKKLDFTHIIVSEGTYIIQSRLETDGEYSQLESTFNNVETSSSGELSTDFEVTLKSNHESVTMIKTLEHLQAKGSATLSGRTPQVAMAAKFEVKALTTGESADVELTADIKSFADFHLRAYADQYFAMFPLVNIYALDITGDMRNAQNPKLSVMITRDDQYTDEVETYDTVLEANIGDLIDPKSIKIPESFVINLKIPNFIFGTVPYNDNSVGYQINTEDKSGYVFITLEPTNAPADEPVEKIAAKLELGLQQKPSIVININFGFSYDGDDFALNQAITLRDNGLTIGEQGLRALKVSLVDIEDTIYLKKLSGEEEELTFKFRLENQNRLFALDSHMTSRTRRADVFKFKFGMVSAEDTANLNRQFFQQLADESNLNPLIVEVFKVAKTCLDPFMVGAGQGMYKMAQGNGGARKKYGGDFTLDVVLLGGEKIEFHIQNNFDTKRYKENFSFSSVFNIDCKVCNAPVTINDFVFDWSGRTNEMRVKWALDLEDKFQFDSSFQIEASVNSFEIAGEPLIELHIDDAEWRKASGIEEVEVKIDFVARNSTDTFVMKMNKLSVEVNRGQYEFRATNGLLEVTHDSQIQMTAMVTHNIDALSEANILERSEFSGDLKLTDIENWNFDATVKVKGAEKRTAALRDLHTIKAKSKFRAVPKQSMAKTGDVTIQSESSLMPELINVRVKKLGMWEETFLVLEAVADLLVSVDADEVLKLKLKQKITGNYATDLTVELKDVAEINAVNKLLENSFELSLKATAPIISESADYRSQLITSWGATDDKYTVGATYTHNIRDISFFKLVPSKMIVNGQAAKALTFGNMEVTLGQYGTSSVTYDVDFGDNEGRISIDIPDVTRQSLVIRTAIDDAGWQLSSSTYDHIIESSAAIKCEKRSAQNVCSVTITNQYQKPTGDAVTANFKGRGMLKGSGQSGATVQKVNIIANVADYTFKIDEKVEFSDKQGEVRLTWNMDAPSGRVSAGKYIRLGGKLKLPTRNDAHATGKVDIQFDDMEPFSMEVNTVVNDGDITVGAQSAIGPIMKLVDDAFGRGTVAKYHLPRNSIVARVSADWLTNKYKFTVVPDRRSYELSLGLERDGVTLYLSQPNNVRYFPTWASGHCELVSDARTSQKNFNCNGKAVLDGLSREATLTSEVSLNFFELGVQIKPNPTAKTIDLTIRHTRSPDPQYNTNALFGRLTSDLLSFESTTTVENKATRRRFQSSTITQMNGTKKKYSINVDYDKRTDIVTISLNGPHLKTEETITVNMKDIAASLRTLNTDMAGSQSILLVPYIESRELPGGRSELALGVKLGANTKVELALCSYMVKRSAPDAELNYGLKLFGRMEESDFEFGGVEIQIFDMRQVVIYHWVHPQIGKIHQIDFNDVAESIHNRINANAHFTRVFFESVVNSVGLEEDSAFKGGMQTLRNNADLGIDYVRNTLNHLVDIALLEIKSTNPIAAVTSRSFHISDIFDGVMTDLITLDESVSAMSSDIDMSMLKEVLPQAFVPDFDKAFEAWAELKKLGSKFFYVNDHEFFLTIPLAIPAKEPKDFDIKDAIMNSEMMQDLKKIVNLQFWIDQWFIIRAGLSKPVQAPFSAVATIVNGRHVITFDGKYFTLSDSDRNRNMILAKDYGRTGSVIQMRNGKVSQTLTAGSGFEIEEIEDGVVEVRAEGKLYGNVAGVLGTISGETYDDGERRGDLSNSSLATRKCNGKAAKWASKPNQKGMRACLPVVDVELFEKRAIFENCQSSGDVCSILKSYQTECRRNGANIALKC